MKDILLKNSLKQIGRTKARMIIFLLLMILTVTFLSLGVNLWQSCNSNIKEYEKVFTTVGLVNQRENSVKMRDVWDAASKQYTYYDKAIYDSILPVSLLNFEGANYIIQPEHRPYYGAYCPDLKIWSPDREEEIINGWVAIYEFIPYEDCIPAEPIKVKVTRVLWGNIQEGLDIWICDHFNDNPGLLEAGKTYITLSQKVFNLHSNSDPKAYYEYFISYSASTTQKNKNGYSLSEDVVSHENWEEVTERFYKTKAGQKWEALVEVNDQFIKNTIPVVPTSKTKLLMSFHQGDVSIYSGRDITEEEYKNGEKVCIVPQGLVTRNSLIIGDKINLQFYYADYERSASKTYHPSGGLTKNFGLLNAIGEAYPVFENSWYEIVGIYGGTDKTNNPTGYEMGYNEVVIPKNSVKNSDDNNIVAYGPMKSYTTSFQIPNGTIKEYQEKFEELGIDNLEISFYDGGYEKLSSGMKNLKMVALILLAVSGATTLAILFFFIFLFISKQKKRTAIERSLGMSRKECTLSMLYGILGVISLGAIIGSLAGFIITGFVMPNSTDKKVELYSTAFSNWVNNSDNAAELSAVGTTNLLTSILLCLVVILISSIIALVFIRNNLKVEPLVLLSKNEE